MDNEIVFDNEIFFTIILPPIIFSAGYSLRKSLFFENFGMISFLGVIGTIIGFICLSLFCSAISSLFFRQLTLQEIMMLSSVLCATDTVAAMSLIKVNLNKFSPTDFLF
jgi:NhaP-type Na+/H+ or K+/H+ antiporter